MVQNIDSDINPPSHDEPFLLEPTMPNPEDFHNPENYRNAMEEYKQKLTTYQARVTFLKNQKTALESKEIQYPHYNDLFPIVNDRTQQRAPFKPAKVAQWLATHDHFKTDKETDNLYFGDVLTGRWTEKGEVRLKEILAKILDEENRESHYRNVLHDLVSLTYADLGFSRKISCENGLLDPETQTFSGFNLDDMAFHSIPVKYDPTATCPNWEEFVKQVVNPDDITTLQEWSGYCLLPDYRFHKIMWIVGSGRNGKGVWQRTIETILGAQNVSSIGLEELDGNHRFAIKQLYGKLFNPCSEPVLNKFGLQTQLLKKATGQDTIDAEIKGKQGRLSFRNCAKITVLANKFPRVYDTTTAFIERRLFLKFPNEFTGDNQIQNIEDNWLKTHDERSGILNWMLQGLKRLLEQGRFTESKTQQETEKEFLRASDTINAFIKECGVFDKLFTTSRSEAFEAYTTYCDILGLEPENEKRFTQKLKETPRVGVCTVSKPQRQRAWKGIKFNPINDDGEVTPVTDVTAKGVLYTPPIFDLAQSNECATRVTCVTPVTVEQSKPIIQVFPEEKTIHYHYIPPNETYRCDICAVLLAKYASVNPSGGMTHYCESCLEEGKQRATAAGYRLVLDLPQSPEENM